MAGLYDPPAEPARASAVPAVPWRTWPALLLLGAASGLPSTLLTDLLATWLTRAGWSTEEVVAIGGCTAAYAVKPLWAPLVDRYASRRLGRRRGWMLGALLACVGGLAVAASSDPLASAGVLTVAIAIAAISSATLDLAVNGWTCEAVPQLRLGIAAGLSVWGYRAVVLLALTLVPLLVAGAGWTWAGAYLAAVGVLALLALAVLAAPEPHNRQPPATLAESVVEPVRMLVQEHGAGGLTLLLAFVLLFRLSDGVAGQYIGPFLAKHFSDDQLAWRGVAGLAGAAIGVAAAGALASRAGIAVALWTFGLLQALSNLCYVAIAQGWWTGLPGFTAALTIDNACGAGAGVVFVAYLMGLCRSRCAATQYALLTAASVLVPHLLRLFGGLAERLGWTWTFLATVVLVIPGLVLLPFVLRKRPATIA